jgi:hypothetical protein
MERSRLQLIPERGRRFTDPPKWAVQMKIRSMNESQRLHTALLTPKLGQIRSIFPRLSMRYCKRQDDTCIVPPETFMKVSYRYLAALGCVVLGIIVLFLEPAQYFFGDSIAVLWGRPHSAGSLINDFARLDGGHWYRPLSNSLPPFLLWPLFGMAFKPYHLVALALHGLLCFGLFEIFRRLLRDLLGAFVGAAFFAFHPVQFYATYDIAFYQESMMAALTLASLVLLWRFVHRPHVGLLAAGLLTFVAALSSKETSVVMPALFLLLLGGTDLWRLRSTRISLLSAGALALFFALLYDRILSGGFRYQPTYRPRIQLHAAADAIRGLLWSFGIPSGVETQAWRYPFGMNLALWLIFFVTIAVAIARPSSGVWRGLVWFILATAPAFSTRHLLPHHLYLGLAGIAFSIGQTVAWLRTRPAYSPVFRSTAYALAALTVALVFCAGYMDARADAVRSWVGESSRRIQATASFVRSAGINLSKSQGIIAAIGDAQVLRFDWMGGAFFNMIGDDDLEVRIVDQIPEQAPEGFYVVEYARDSLHKLSVPQRVPAEPSVVEAAPSAVHFGLTADRVYAGSDSYCLSVPQFAGQTIDVKYEYNQRPASVAYSFARLNSLGTACIYVSASVPWGRVNVVGVRPSGSWRWYNAHAEIEVLPPSTW